VAKFIPGFKDVRVYVSGENADMVTEPQNNPMTLHHLLTHTSGLTYGFGNPGLIPELYQARHTDFKPHDGPLQEVVDRLAQIPLEFQPGQRWNYGVSFDCLSHSPGTAGADVSGTDRLEAISKMPLMKLFCHF
jgi:CubicO group peptidase (beta-lactamase class C family)